MSDTTTIRVTRDALNGPGHAAAGPGIHRTDLADRAVGMTRVGARIGNVGPAVLRRIRDTVAIAIDV